MSRNCPVLKLSDCLRILRGGSLEGAGGLDEPRPATASPAIKPDARL